MKPKSTTTTAVEQMVATCVDFEVTLTDLSRRSERRAWTVAWGAIAMSLLLAGGYYYALPLKEKVPFLVMADAYTGTSTVARLKDDSTHGELTASEAINRSNVAHFLLARESYDVDMMQLRDWRLVHTMSSPEVAAGYAAEHAGNNPRAPYHVHGRGRAIRARILSLVMLGGGKGAAPKGATVRFQRSLYDKSTGTSRPLDSKIATLSFEYKSNLKMDERERVENPLGFQVTSYRVDSDYAAAPSLDAINPPVMGKPTPKPPRPAASMPTAPSATAVSMGDSATRATPSGALQ